MLSVAPRVGIQFSTRVPAVPAAFPPQIGIGSPSLLAIGFPSAPTM